MIQIKKTSPFTGKVNSMDIPMSEREYMVSFMNWENGQLIQDAFPTLNPDQREFIKTGITPEDWSNTFGDE